MHTRTKLFTLLFTLCSVVGASNFAMAAPKVAPKATTVPHQSFQVQAKRDGTTKIKMQPTATSPALECVLRPSTQRAPSCNLCSAAGCNPLPTEIEICNNDGWCVGCGEVREGLGCWISSPSGTCGVVTYESGTWSGCV